VQRRLAVVDPTARVDRHKHVVVEAGEVVLALAAGPAAGDPPWWRAGKILARHGGEGLLDARVPHTSQTGDLGGVAPSEFCGSVGHCLP
jgi:hypothetical protein